MARTVIYDGPDCTITEVTSPGWPDAQGSTRTEEIVWKAGSVGGDDQSAEAFIRAQLPAAVVKAKQILAAPGAGTPVWTAAEQRVILALVVLDLQHRMR